MKKLWDIIIPPSDGWWHKKQTMFFEWSRWSSRKEQEAVVERVLEWISGGESIREVEKGCALAQPCTSA